MAPLAPSLVDLVPQEVAGPVAHGVADAFLARHSQDKNLHRSIFQGGVKKVLSNDNSSEGASYVDGMMNLNECNKAQPYAGGCEADVHSRLPFPLPPLLGGPYDSQNAVGGYAYNEFNSSNYNSFRSGFVLGTNRPQGMGCFDIEPCLPLNGQVGLNLNISMPMNQRFHSGWTGVNAGSSGLPDPHTVTWSNGAYTCRHESAAESSGTSQYTQDTTRSNVLNTSGVGVFAGANRRCIEAGSPSEDSRITQLLAHANTNHKLQGTGASLLSATTGGSVLNRDFGNDLIESTDNSLLALEQRVEEACALVERVLREREERGREIERKEREMREQRARKRREGEARELEKASRWPQQQEPINGRSQWLCEHYQRHCRVRFPCCSHFYSCHRCHNNSKACDNEEAKASHATHLKCSFCHHEQEVSIDIQ